MRQQSGLSSKTSRGGPKQDGPSAGVASAESRAEGFGVLEFTVQGSRVRGFAWGSEFVCLGFQGFAGKVDRPRSSRPHTSIPIMLWTEVAVSAGRSCRAKFAWFRG